MRAPKLRLTIAAALSGVGLLIGAPSANADPDDCTDYTCEDDGDVVITPTDPGNPGSPGGPGTENTGGGGTASCAFEGRTIPCTSENGVWSSAYGCYLQLAPGGGPPPPAATNPNGAWYWCIAPGATSTVRTMWLDNPPEALPSPAELAQEALERMNLEPIEIGIVPEDEPGRIGLVGMPVWMWVQEPTENTFGPITESAAAG